MNISSFSKLIWECFLEKLPQPELLEVRLAIGNDLIDLTFELRKEVISFLELHDEYKISVNNAFLLNFDQLDIKKKLKKEITFLVNCIKNQCERQNRNFISVIKQHNRSLIQYADNDSDSEHTASYMNTETTIQSKDIDISDLRYLNLDSSAGHIRILIQAEAERLRSILEKLQENFLDKLSSRLSRHDDSSTSGSTAKFNSKFSTSTNLCFSSAISKANFKSPSNVLCCSTSTSVLRSSSQEPSLSELAAERRHLEKTLLLGIHTANPWLQHQCAKCHPSCKGLDTRIEHSAVNSLCYRPMRFNHYNILEKSELKISSDLSDEDFFDNPKKCADDNGMLSQPMRMVDLGSVYVPDQNTLARGRGRRKSAAQRPRRKEATVSDSKFGHEFAPKSAICKATGLSLLPLRSCTPAHQKLAHARTLSTSHLDRRPNEFLDPGKVPQWMPPIATGSIRGGTPINIPSGAYRRQSEECPIKDQICFLEAGDKISRKEHLNSAQRFRQMVLHSRESMTDSKVPLSVTNGVHASAACERKPLASQDVTC